MTIVELRIRQNDLATRFKNISEAIETIFSLSVPFTSTMAKASLAAWEQCIKHREGHEWDDEPDYSGMVNSAIPFTSDDFFFPLLKDDTEARNIAHACRAIQNLASQGLDPIPTEYLLDMAEPATTHWLPEEIETVGRRYRTRITNAITRIRDINTHWKSLDKHEHELPSFIKSSLLGLFGTADLLGDFQYSEDDFMHRYHLRDTGKTEPRVMSARWLAPFVGLRTARVIEVAMNVIGSESAPLPGEPPTLDYFGSHVSNVIKIFEE